MKKENITLEPDFDEGSRLCLKITKRKGKLTLDEVAEACESYDEGFFCYVFRVAKDSYQVNEDFEGDQVIVYPLTSLEINGDKLL